MESLLGRRFSLQDVEYAIVDVRNMQGETMVYAEPASASHGPGRAAFRYADVEPQLIAEPAQAS